MPSSVRGCPASSCQDAALEVSRTAVPSRWEFQPRATASHYRTDIDQWINHWEKSQSGLSHGWGRNKTNSKGCAIREVYGALERFLEVLKWAFVARPTINGDQNCHDQLLPSSKGLKITNSWTIKHHQPITSPIQNPWSIPLHWPHLAARLGVFCARRASRRPGAPWPRRVRCEDAPPRPAGHRWHLAIPSGKLTVCYWK